MADLNNRPGGPNLIVTAKTAHKVHFLDAATLTMSATIDMPGSTHELALSPDGRTAYGSVYGDGVFAKRVNPDRRIVVIDLPSKSLTRIIDLGAVYAPHGVMMDEPARSGRQASLAMRCWRSIRRPTRCRRSTSARPRIGSRSAMRPARSSSRSSRTMSSSIDIARRAVIDRIKIPHAIEGLAISPDGATLYCCAQTRPSFT